MYLLLALASCTLDGIITGTIAFLAHNYQNEAQHDFFGHVRPLAPVFLHHIIPMA